MTLFSSYDIALGSGSSIYGHQNNLVFKADSSGQTIWVKDFSGYVCSATTDTNDVRSVVSDGKRVYVMELQGTFPGVNGRHYYPCISVLDTLGNVIKTSYYDLDIAGANYYLVSQLPSLNGGDWMFSNCGGGTQEYAIITKIDTSGNATRKLFFHQNVTTNIAQAIALPDSNFLVLILDYTVGQIAYSRLAKFRDDGTILWEKDYHSIAAFQNLNEIIGLASFVVDSTGNIYAFGYYLNTFTNQIGSCGIKMNSSGIPLLSRFWPDSTIYPGPMAISVSGGMIKCVSGITSEVYFDTMLTNPCLISDTLNVFAVNRIFGYVNFADPFLNSSFTPQIVQNFQINNHPISYPDICSIQSKIEISSQEAFTIWPNPARKMLNISGLAIPTETQIQIFDFGGKLLQTLVVNDRNEVDISRLLPGMYFVKITSGSQQSVLRFVKMD